MENLFFEGTWESNTLFVFKVCIILFGIFIIICMILMISTIVSYIRTYGFRHEAVPSHPFRQSGLKEFFEESNTFKLMKKLFKLSFYVWGVGISILVFSIFMAIFISK